MSERAALLLESGLAPDRLIEESGRLRAPVRVEDPGGGLHSWFVGVTVGDRLAGFLQILPDLTLMRYSSFQRRPQTLEGCPRAGDWLDTAHIRRRAAEARPRGETPGEPRLTYDGNPSRIVWAVPMTGAGGETREVFVAGDYAYEPAPGGSSAGLEGGAAS